jgi:hypothetical protein
MYDFTKKQDNNSPLIKRLVIIAFVLFLALIIYFVFFLHGRITVEVTPENAIVTINNKPMEVKNGKSSFAVTLGKHILKVEADDYIGYKEEIVLKRGKNYSKKISLVKAPTPVEIATNVKNFSVKDDYVFYQNKSDELIYRVKLERKTDGNIEIKENQAITSRPINGVDKIVWSPDKNLLLLKRGTTVNLFDFKKYDFVNQKETLFGENIGDIIWSPDDSRIAYYYAPPSGERSIIFANKTNEIKYRVANLSELGISNPHLAFSPNSERLLMIPRNKNFKENKIYLINVFTKVVQEVDSTGDQKEAIFTSDSKRIIFSTYSSDKNNPYNQTLSVMDRDGGNKKSLKINGVASMIRYWNDPNKIFLPRSGDSSKLILYDLENGGITDFYFKGQNDAEISEIVLDDSNSAAVFISKDKLYYVNLAGND